MDLWQKRAQRTAQGNQLGFETKKDGVTIGLLRKPSIEPWDEFTCLNSLRDVEPTANLIRRQARDAGRAVEVEAVLVEGAFAALQAGHAAEHDERVLAALEDLLRRSDVVVLAQASMARLLGSLSEPPRVPILTSPLSGLRAAEAQLSALSAR